MQEEWIELEYDNGKTFTANDQFYYIRLGSFLEFLEKHIIYESKSGTNPPEPIIKFDIDEESNIMYSHPYQISMDPEICVINKNFDYKVQVYNKSQGPNRKFKFTDDKGDEFLSKSLKDIKVNNNLNVYGKIMNIYVNMKFILKKLEEFKDVSTNKTVLIDFLNGMLESINGAIGGNTYLEATIDEDTIIIRDTNPLPNREEVIKTLNNIRKDKINNNSAEFLLYGYKDGKAGFIKDFNFTTEITPALSTTITVGATANNAVVGENSTAFSRMNIGLEDRFKTLIEEPTPTNNKNIQKEDPKIILEKKMKELTKYYLELAFQTGIKAKLVNEPSTRKDALTNFITYYDQINNTQTSSSFVNTGFIPFNMSITMDGLSGMKIYNKFNIDTSYLPSNYPETCEFVIKGIEHKIEKNQWSTTLESIVISKEGS